MDGRDKHGHDDLNQSFAGAFATRFPDPDGVRAALKRTLSGPRRTTVPPANAGTSAADTTNRQSLFALGSGAGRYQRAPKSTLFEAQMVNY